MQQIGLPSNRRTRFLTVIVFATLIQGCVTSTKSAPKETPRAVTEPVPEGTRYEAETGYFVTKKTGAMEVMNEHCQGAYHVEDKKDSEIAIGISTKDKLYVRYRCK